MLVHRGKDCSVITWPSRATTVAHLSVQEQLKVNRFNSWALKVPLISLTATKHPEMLKNIILRQLPLLLLNLFPSFHSSTTHHSTLYAHPPPVISTLKYDEATAATQIMTQTTGLSLPDWTQCLTDRMLQLNPGSVHHTISAQFRAMLEGFTPSWRVNRNGRGGLWWKCHGRQEKRGWRRWMIGSNVI